MLKQRVITAVVAVVILLSVLFLAPVIVARLTIGLLFVAAAWEWSQFLGSPSVALRSGFTALVSLTVLALGFFVNDPAVQMSVFLLAVAWWLMALLWTFYFPTPIPYWLAWFGGLLVLVPAYVALDWLYLVSPFLLFGVLALVWIADIGAYFSGRAFGRVKLAPKISPGKTWAGVFGGLALSLSAAAASAAYLAYDLAVILPFAAAVVVISIVGDLTVSMFKRHSGIKDSGTLFPGHGGVLDRIDSVCAAAPVVAAGSIVLGLV